MWLASSVSGCRRRLVCLAPVLFVLAPALAAAPAADDAPVFELPQRHAQVQQIRLAFHALLQQEQYARAETLVREAIKLLPRDPVNYYNLACVEARRGRTEPAIGDLDNALQLGFRGVRILLRDEDLVSLRQHAKWNDLLTRASDPPQRRTRQVTPEIIRDHVARITENNTVYDPRSDLLRVFFRRESDELESLKKQPVAKGLGEVGDLLLQWQKNGTAAGLTSVLYHNHDKYHSRMEDRLFPQLSRIELNEAGKQAGHGNGLQEWFLFNGIVLGNSSTAATNSPLWRSQTRYAYASSVRSLKLAAQSASNHLYVYVEHRDYDPGHNGNGQQGSGDVFPANTPYVVTSQGSSGSDRVFLKALACSLAAMRPDVQDNLAASRTLMPALQMILRRNYGPVNSDEDYLTGKAHPVVFNGESLKLEDMVRMAHAITADTLPPVARLRIVEEEEFQVGVDYFDGGPREKMFSTPQAIARVGRAVRQKRSIQLSADASRDLNGNKLTYHWVLLQGDPDRVTIQAVKPDASEARITVGHHERRPIQPGSTMETNRVDIALFVHNGHYYSAPAFLTYYFPDNEDRRYDAEGRVQSVTWSDPAKGGNYVDPMIVTAQAWKDEYIWRGGQLTGWTRWRGSRKQRFTADGARVLTTDDLDRPLTTQPVKYVRVPRSRNIPRLEEQPLAEIRRYTYTDDMDFVGQFTVLPPKPAE